MVERLWVWIPAGAAGEFSSLCVLTVIRCPLHHRVTAVACKRAWSFCQKCRWQITRKHVYTLDPTKSEWADYAAVEAQRGNLSGELSRDSSGNTRPQLSQLAEPLWTDPGLKSGISVRELISTKAIQNKKRKKKRRWGMNGQTFSQNPRMRGQSHHHHHGLFFLFFVNTRLFFGENRSLLR